MGGQADPTERVEIELIVVDGDRPRSALSEEHPSFAESVRRGYDVVREHTGDLQAAPGYRPGAVPAPIGTRRGGDCDIVRSMRVDPWTASTIAGSRAFRRDAHRNLTFLEADAGDDRALTWKVLVASPRLRPVPATLHLRASASMVLSVLELIPRRKLRWRRTAFIATGVEAVDSLVDDFEHQLRAPVIVRT